MISCTRKKCKFKVSLSIPIVVYITSHKITKNPFSYVLKRFLKNYSMLKVCQNKVIKRKGKIDF